MTPKTKTVAPKLPVKKQKVTSKSPQPPEPAPLTMKETTENEGTLSLPPSSHSVKIRFRDRVAAIRTSKNLPDAEARKMVAKAIASEGLLVGQVIEYLDDVRTSKTGETYGTTRHGYLADLPEGEEYLQIIPIGAYGRELSPTIHVVLDNVVGTSPQLAKEPVMAEIKARKTKGKTAKKAKKAAASTANGHAGRAAAVINEVQLLRMPKEGEKMAKQPLAFLQALEDSRSKKLPFDDLIKAVSKSGVKTIRPWDAIFRLRRKSLVEGKYITVS